MSDDDLARMLASGDPIVRRLAEKIREAREKQRAYFQRPEVKEKQRAYFQRPEVKEKKRAYYQRRKIESYAREVAGERGISFEQAMREIDA